MDSARLKQIEELYHAALALAPAEREAFFELHCGADRALRREVESLLSCEKSFDSLIDALPESLAAEIFPAPETRESLIGKKFGRYRIVKLLGKGGMGEVYLADDLELERPAAIKVLSAEIAGDVKRIRRFIQEAKAASALNHPNILTVYEIGEIEGWRFMATEFIKGSTLSQRLRAGNPALAETLEIAVQIASALEAAHAAGIVHRDIKPDNIMIREDGIVKVLDFGLAKLAEKRVGDAPDTDAATRQKISTLPGVIMGTPHFMSPEQARGLALDRQTDIFSFGVVLYEMLAGRLPFDGETTSDIIAAVLTKEPRPVREFNAELPPALSEIVRLTLEKDQQKRFRSARALLDDLKKIQKRLEYESQFKAAPETESAPTLFAAADKPKSRLSPPAPAGAPSSRPASIAVLPFVNASGDADMEYLSEGISESIINLLSKLPRLKVIARNSSFKYKNADTEEAARVLGVNALVTGRIRRFGDDLQVSAEVMNTADNTQIWGEQYLRHPNDLLKIQTEIAREVTDNLRLKLTDSEQFHFEKAETVSAKAYELLLKGRFYWNKGGTENRRRGVEFFEKAIAADADYALAYAELSAAYRSLVASSLLAPEIFTPKAEEFALKALALDAHLAEAHLALAWIKRDAWAWREAEIEFQKALRLNPNFARAHNAYAYYLSIVGRHDDAAAEIMRVKELDPASPVSYANVATIFYFARRFDEALEALREALELDPAYPNLYSDFGYIYAAQGEFENAAAAFRKAFETGSRSPSTKIFLGMALAKNGQREAAQKILNELEQSEKYVSPGELAILYGALGKPDKAFDSLENAYAEHDLQLQYLGNDPAFDDLRADTRFSSLLRRIGLARDKATDEISENPTAILDAATPDPAEPLPPDKPAD